MTATIPPAEVIAVHPRKIRIAIYDIEKFRRSTTSGTVRGDGEEVALRVGSYIRVFDHEDCGILAIIENFTIEPAEDGTQPRHIIEAMPVGFLDSEGRFQRGGNRIAIPPKGAAPARQAEVQAVFQVRDVKRRFRFARLAQAGDIHVPVDGDNFFNKHFAIVGSTGCGKSFTLARILQNAVEVREGSYHGLNNAHIVVFDLHGEYSSALPAANHVNVTNLALPYWLMNSEELGELFIETTDSQAYNQASLLRRLIVCNKRMHGAHEKASIDTPARFDIEQVLTALMNLNTEKVRSNSPTKVAIKNGDDLVVESDEQRFKAFFEECLDFDSATSPADKKTKAGAFKELDRFISRIQAKVDDPRLRFLFDPSIRDRTLENVLEQLLGYSKDDHANITVLDLSGIPFEVLSITVSLITRLAFDFAYHLKREQIGGADRVPFLLIYEEAHRYVPRESATKYRACQTAIERIAKEGRKYAITLAISSQRPSEVSETIFAQCNNFVVMRLTNPADQNAVSRLLPDTLGPLVDALPTLPQGHALLIGDAVVIPAWVKIDLCDPVPDSNDVAYLQEWKKPWVDAEFAKVAARWVRPGTQ